MNIETSAKYPAIRRAARGALLGAALSVITAPLSLPVQAGSAEWLRDLRAALQPAEQNQQTSELADTEAPRIQLAILLDTSNSMDGLIDQTRNQLWQVVNEFSSARQDGRIPILEIALFEYGNSGNAAGAGFSRMISPFTRELDAVSQGLFSLTTNGGDEYCGYAIKTAVEQLQWSRSASDIRIIFIAGNEAFTQGPIDYRQATALARRNGIAVNTIHAGAHQEGIDGGWQAGAVLAGGDYMSIDANRQVVHIVAPQDERIAELNARLNETYLPYGDEGEEKLQRQFEQDAQSGDISLGLLSSRAVSKSSAFYSNSKWDLVDAFREGEVGADEMAQMDADVLPEPMRDLPAAERLDYVSEQAEARKRIQREISGLSRTRAAYVAEKQREQAAAAPSMSDALTRAIRKRAAQKNFVFME